jgi:type IV pilus assembly protein PilA
MRKNTKGFTLIELLAVIVILAIIALITTPIILNVINNARKDAAKNKAYGTIEAVNLAYTQAQSTEEVSLPVTVTFKTDGTSSAVGTSTQVTVNGEKPTGGTVTIDTDGKIKVSALIFGNYSCTGDNSTKDNMKCTVVIK